MRLLLAILFAGCTSAPSPRLVANLRSASLAASSRECRRPVSNRKVIDLARRNLDAYATLLWMRMDPMEGLVDPVVTLAIRGVLPRCMKALDCEKALYAASDSLP